jgi:hypothetical protein
VVWCGVVWCGVEWSVVEFVLRSLFAASGSRLVFKILPSIKIWYTFGVFSKFSGHYVLAIFW